LPKARVTVRTGLEESRDAMQREARMDKERAVDAVTAIAVFKGRQVRRVLHEGKWWFSVVDVAGALTDSPDPGAYWRKLKQRLTDEGREVVTFCHGLKLPAATPRSAEPPCRKAASAIPALH
jgi:hypothetical protein